VANSDDKLSVHETAELLDISVKAVQQAISRDAFPEIERERDRQTGRTQRVWIPRSDVEAYAHRRGISLSVLADPPFPVGSPERRAVSSKSSPAWRTVLEQLQAENLDLRLKLAEASRRSPAFATRARAPSRSWLERMPEPSQLDTDA
jgi:hypothetical protein